MFNQLSILLAADVIPEATTSESASANAILPRLTEQIKGAFKSLETDVFNLLPGFVAAVVIFILGMIVAKIITAVIRKMFKTINLDGIFDKVGISPVLNKVGLSSGPATFIPKILYFLLILFIVRLCADIYGSNHHASWLPSG